MSLLPRFLRRSPLPKDEVAPAPLVVRPEPTPPPQVFKPTPPPAAAPLTITVTIEYDVAPHIDRAVALMKSATLLNFTKFPGRPNLDRTVKELRNLLTLPNIVAGLVYVRRGDEALGLVGIYVVRVLEGKRLLLHFCFDDAVAGTGVPAWLYRRLGQPEVDIRSGVAEDLAGDTAKLGRIALAAPEMPAGTIYARGSGDLAAVLHYFELHGHAVRCDFNIERDGATLQTQHSVVARHAIDGLEPAALDALSPLGYRPEDFSTVLAQSGARAVWLMSFFSDAQSPLCRHRSTNVLIPARIPRKPDEGEAETPEQAQRRRYLKQNFEPAGLIEEGLFKENLHAMLKLAVPDTRIFMLLMNDMRQVADNKGDLVIARNRLVNDWTSTVAADYRNVSVLRMTDFVSSPHEAGRSNHFDRLVYVRLFSHIAGLLSEQD
jgi:hypothetical protein